MKLKPGSGRRPFTPPPSDHETDCVYSTTPGATAETQWGRQWTVIHNGFQLRLCIFGPKGAIQICYYYYYYCNQNPQKTAPLLEQRSPHCPNVITIVHIS